MDMYIEFYKQSILVKLSVVYNKETTPLISVKAKLAPEFFEKLILVKALESFTNRCLKYRHHYLLFSDTEA